MNKKEQNPESQSKPSYASPFECDESIIIAAESWDREGLKSALKNMQHPDDGSAGHILLLLPQTLP